MLRGRRPRKIPDGILRGKVGMLVGLFLLPSLLQPLPLTSRKAIEQNSTYTLDASSYRNLAIVTIQAKNGKEILHDQTIQAFLLQDGALVDFQEKQANEDGKYTFTFVYKKGASYEVIILNSSYQYPFIMKTLSF